MIIVVFISLVLLILALATIYRQNQQIKSLKEDAETYKKVAERTQEIYEGFKSRAMLSEQSFEIFHIEYSVTDAIAKKYTSKESEYRAIKNKLAMVLGNRLAKQFEPDVLPMGDGVRKYSLALKIKKIW